MKYFVKIVQKIALPQVQVIHPLPKMPSSVNHTNFLDWNRFLTSPTVKLLFNMLKTSYGIAITNSINF